MVPDDYWISEDGLISRLRNGRAVVILAEQA